MNLKGAVKLYLQRVPYTHRIFYAPLINAGACNELCTIYIFESLKNMTLIRTALAFYSVMFYPSVIIIITYTRINSSVKHWNVSIWTTNRRYPDQQSGIINLTVISVHNCEFQLTTYENAPFPCVPIQSFFFYRVTRSLLPYFYGLEIRSNDGNCFHIITEQTLNNHQRTCVTANR